MTPSRIAIDRVRPVLLVAGWLGLVIAGRSLALRYESSAGPAVQLPAHVASSTAPLPSLLVFAHPQCPCTRATLEELDRIAARIEDRARIEVLVLSDPAEPRDWTYSAIWDRAARIPGVVVQADVHGEKARALGVATSGETLLFDRDGRPLFHGGITSARGHVGDNVGAETVVEAVLGRPTTISSTPVYGCSLFHTSP